MRNLEEFGEWTSRNDVRYWVDGAQTESLIPTRLVTELLREVFELEDELLAACEAFVAFMTLRDDRRIAGHTSGYQLGEIETMMRAVVARAKEAGPNGVSGKT